MDIVRRLQAISAPRDDVARLRQSPHEMPARSIRASVRTGPPDLQTQLEDLLGEVWRQEQFERNHPYTCSVIRQLN